MQPMTSMRRSSYLFLGLFLVLSVSRVLSAQQTHAPHQLGHFTGVWVRTVNQRIFLVLDLKLHAGKLEGTLSRPRHFSDVAGEGSTVTDPETVLVPILDATVIGSDLHFSTPDPSGTGKPNESTLILWDGEDASLAYGNLQSLPRWILKRVPRNETPTVSTTWPSDQERTFSHRVLAIQQQLHAMVTEDQATDRPPYTQFIEVCKRNFPIIKELFQKYGWLKKSEFGKQAASDFWLLSAHQANAHPQFASEELLAMKQAMEVGQASAANYALFYDNVAEAQGRPQHWGTKTVCENGEHHLYKVDDLAGLDRRRDEALLPPEASFLRDLLSCPK